MGEDGIISRAILERQDDVTTTKVIEVLLNDDNFVKLSEREGKLIIERDEEDANALKAGIVLAQKKGVLPIQDPKTYTAVEVEGKNADQVADEIIQALSDKAEKGCVVCLVGLSGTGKGTTVEKLKQKLAKAATWSNGNVFRSLTLFASIHCEQEKKDFTPDVLTSENLSTWIKYLSFGKNDKGLWDIKIDGLGIKANVSEVQNTLLKEPRVAKNIPTVAKQTQGEVIAFAGNACKMMGEDGSVVLLEGREQTLDFIPADFRFCLTMKDTSLLGKRRAAQRVAAATLEKPVDMDITLALKESCQQLVA